MIQHLQRFWWDEEGQDLIEYTLMLAFVTLASAGLMSKAGQSVNVVWTAGKLTLSNAATAAS